MNVVISSYTFPPEIGGVATNVSILAEAFAQAGHNTTVVTTAEGGPDEVGFRVVRKPSPLKLLYLYANADIIILSNLSIGLSYPLVILRKRYALRHHSDSALRISNYKLSTDTIRRLIYRNAEHFTTSNFIGKRLKLDKYTITYPFANIKYTSRYTSVPFSKRRGAIFVGRMEKEKGIECLLEHWMQIRNFLSIDHLVLVGDGSSSP